MSFCLNCGRRVEEGARRCAGCGAPFGEAARPDEAAGLPPEVQQLALNNRKVEAIKAYRIANGATLRDAKEAVESWMQVEGITRSNSGGCGTSVVLLALLGGGILSFMG